MKLIYKILSGLLLSIMITLAMIGLISVSTLTKPKADNLKMIESKEQAKEIFRTIN